MKTTIVHIFFLTTILYSSIIQIDGQFSDWDGDPSIFHFEDSISDTDGTDLLNLSITNDENFLFIKIKLDREIDLLDDFENPSDIIIQIDADNNSTTGYSVGGIGSEYGIRCLDKFVYDNADLSIPFEDCSNAADDDGDGFIDCEDEDCAYTSYCSVPFEDCSNEIDDDGDGFIDCDDWDCDDTSDCGNSFEDCSNEIDDDGDGFIDCDDWDCDGTSDCGISFEDCSNEIDDDGDGFIDCDDWDCDDTSGCDDNIESLSFVQFRALPSITSDEFEIAIGRRHLGESIFNDTIAIIIKENHSNDFIPNEGEILTFTFDDTYHEPVELIEISKENPELLRVMAYNTLSDGLKDNSRIDRFVRIINTINPQIIGFNETRQTSEQDVHNVLDSALGGNWYVLKHDPENITASRFPIVDSWGVHNKIQASLIDLDDEGLYMLFIVGHLSCCGSDNSRQEQVDRFTEFILDAKTPGGEITVPENTPIVFLGDMNLVGYSQQYYTILEGDIQDTDSYGEGGFPDWDNSELEDVICRQTDKRMAYTWRNDDRSEYPPGRLDFIFYTNSVMSVAKSFTLQTEIMSGERLENYGLFIDDTKSASDHFPIVADFNLLFNEDCNYEGDINNDGSIDIVDIVIVVDYIINYTDIELECADINHDGYINVVDVVQLVSLILN